MEIFFIMLNMIESVMLFKKAGYSSVLRIKYSQWKEDKNKCILRLESKLYELQHLPSTHPSFHLQFNIE